ncbi:DUF445 domain-containing protein [Cyclobacterium sp. 1_MG-2023]|uniref:DUF445 domain-containing protein n=1 Tax=Cyclobacterium sp. 1_MG-2023 TaxID=3062681 RepID=UPI0026E15078|nr:DUF445 domain-containing protein [Cyclobacterium sp. 1_MG-2023]MDO6439013.1 DUF445 domain-containing protein [Cyclobacterium sp. 1_MG-2023]
MKSKIGRNSLLIAISGFLLLELGIYFDFLKGDIWRILATGFEAGTIGGLADWFAVSALFYEIPIPYVRKHTNIIVKNRSKLTEGIVDLVTTQWLSPEVLRERLTKLKISDGVLQALESDGSRKKLLDFFSNVFIRLSGELDNPKLVVLIQKLLKDRLQSTDIAKPLGVWLNEVMVKGKHHEFMAVALDQFALSIQEPDTRALILGKLKDALLSYANRDWVKKSAVWIGKKTGGIDPDLMIDRIMDLVLALLEEVKNDKDHPIRKKLEGYVLEFSANLENEDEKTLAYVEKLKRNWVLNEQTKGMIQKLLSQIQESIQEQFSTENTPVKQLIDRQLKRFLNELREDVQSKSQIDIWMRSTITQLVTKYHPELGEMVRSSLAKLDDEGIMLQIKNKVGNDLQYIRLNGAVVGGMVGIFIALLRWLIH